MRRGGLRAVPLAPVAVALAGLVLVLASFLGRPSAPCLVEDGGACADARLTGRADGHVSSIDQEQPGVPIWYVGFDVGGTTVQAASTRWPAAPGGPANGPRVGDPVHVAYDPAAPTQHVTDADALAALPSAPPGPSAGRTAVRVAGALLLAAAVALGVRRRRRPPDVAAVPPSTDGDAR